MILVDYYLYKIYAFFLKKPVYETLAANFSFTILLLLNVDSILSIFGNPLESDILRYCQLGLFVLMNVLLYFFYEKRGRYKKIYEKFSKESPTSKIAGWILVLCYIVGTIIFAILS